MPSELMGRNNGTSETNVDYLRRDSHTTEEKSKEVPEDSLHIVRAAQPQQPQQRANRVTGFKRVIGHSHYICCCVLTQDGPNSLCVVVLILLPVLIFLIGVVPRDEVWSYIIVSILTTLAVASLILSVTVDPGIIPPLPPDPDRQPETVIVNGREIECKVCRTCNILRPPRSAHCRFCNYCVDGFDHHCGVVGSCVAKRTFRFFGGFFIFTALLVLYIGIRSLFALVGVRHDVNTGEGRWDIAASVISIVAATLGGCPVLPMAVYYIYLGCMNSTQKEGARLSLGLCEPNHAYHQGYCRNFFLRYFGPLGESRISSRNANLFV